MKYASAIIDAITTVKANVRNKVSSVSEKSCNIGDRLLIKNIERLERLERMRRKVVRSSISFFVFHDT